MYGLRGNNEAVFVRNFSALSDYIGKNLEFRSFSVQDLKDIKGEYEDQIDPVEISSNNPLVICNVVIGQKAEKKRKEKIQAVSEFVTKTDPIFSQVLKDHFVPLALIDNFSYPWIYTDVNHRWESHFRIDRSQLKIPIQKRTLPNSIQYPFVTIEDFLEDNLLRLPTDIHSEKYICGTFKKGVDKSYLPPIKKEYFQYFNTETLDKHLHFEPDNTDPDVVVVSLEIPLRKGKKMTFQKKYYSPQEKNIPPSAGRFYLVDITLGIFPFYKTNDPLLDNEYRIMLLHRGESSLSFWARPDAFSEEDRPEKASPIHNLEQLAERYDRSDVNVQEKRNVSSYYRARINFEVIELRHRENSLEIKACIIPRWPTNGLQPTTKTAFSVDFGTTNTHVAYRFDGEPQPFNFSEKDMPVAMLDHPNEIIPGESNYQRFDQLAVGGTYSNLYRHEFMPSIIGVPDSVWVKYKFPTRSILVEDKKLGMYGKTAHHQSLQNVNIDFAYEVHPFGELPLKAHHNLKWSFDNNLENTERIKGYIEQLLFLIRTKVILNGYHPKNAEVRWFYPLSLTANHRGMLFREWNSLYKQFFNPNGQTIPINESEAPYYWHRRDNRIKATDYVLSIDIGGGTSDVVLIHNQEIISGTSYRYAGNALFGNGLLKKPGIENGLARFYQDEFQRIFTHESLSNNEARKIFDEIRGENSEVLVNYFFSSKEFKFSNRLSGDKHFKLSIILHFAATLWHTGQWARKLMIKKKISAPDVIALSGNASRLVDIILNGNPEMNKSALNKLAANVFKKVFGTETPIPDYIPFIVNDNPKELTCLGGLAPGIGSTAEGMIPSVYMGATFDQENPVHEKLIYEQLARLSKAAPSYPTNANKGSKFSPEEVDGIVNGLRESVVNNVQEFIKFFEEQIEEIDFDYSFGASKPIDIDLKAIFSKKKMEEYLYEGIIQMKNIGMEPDARVNQTLFFLPIIGGLFDLNNQLYEIKVSSKK